MRWISGLVLFIPVLIAPPAVAQSLTRATMVAVTDGDTIRVSRSGRVITIRMACIDAPEMDQPQGPQSATRLSQLIPRNTALQLRTVEVDRYGRIIAEVYRNRVSVNLQMVQEGRAIADRRSLYGCERDRDRYLRTEQTARDRRLAFWSQDNPVIALDRRNDTPPNQIVPIAVEAVAVEVSTKNFHKEGDL